MGLRYLGSIEAKGYTGNSVLSGLKFAPGMRVLVQCKGMDFGMCLSASPTATCNPSDHDALMVASNAVFETPITADADVIAVGSDSLPEFFVSVFEVTT